MSTKVLNTSLIPKIRDIEKLFLDEPRKEAEPSIKVIYVDARKQCCENSHLSKRSHPK
jgi:hypothetical protein